MLVSQLKLLINICARLFIMRDFVRGCQRRRFMFQVIFCPVTRVIRTGFHPNKADYSRGDIQISTPLLEARSCENFVLRTSCSDCLVRTNCSWTNGGAFWSISWKQENEFVWILITMTVKNRETDGSCPRVVRLAPRREGSFSII